MTRSESRAPPTQCWDARLQVLDGGVEVELGKPLEALVAALGPVGLLAIEEAARAGSSKLSSPMSGIVRLFPEGSGHAREPKSEGVGRVGLA